MSFPRRFKNESSLIKFSKLYIQSSFIKFKCLTFLGKKMNLLQISSTLLFYLFIECINSLTTNETTTKCMNSFYTFISLDFSYIDLFSMLYQNKRLNWNIKLKHLPLVVSQYSLECPITSRPCSGHKFQV